MELAALVAQAHSKGGKNMGVLVFIIGVLCGIIGTILFALCVASSVLSREEEKLYENEQD